MDTLLYHEGKGYNPDGGIGAITKEEVDRRNAESDDAFVEWLKSGPLKVTLYVTHPQKDTSERCGNSHHGDEEYLYKLTTWMGTVVAKGWCCYVGDKAMVGFQGHYRGGTYRRPVSARIFGVLYHGWYMESSGQYCRLKKAKRQNVPFLG